MILFNICPISALAVGSHKFLYCLPVSDNVNESCDRCNTFTGILAAGNIVIDLSSLR